MPKPKAHAIIQCIIAGGLFIAPPVSAEPEQVLELERVPVHSGTGFFISPEFIITNEHVVHGTCANITIRDQGKDWAKATLVTVDSAHDLALLHTDKWPRDTAVLRSDFEGLKAGDPVVVVGYPDETLKNNQDYEVATAKMVNTQESFGNNWMMQFSHAIKPGYSGGPLLDMSGKVVGVVKGISTIYEAKTNMEVEEIDEAIDLISLEEFLMANNAFYTTLKEAEKSAGGLDFVVNIQCEEAAQAVQEAKKESESPSF